MNNEYKIFYLGVENTEATLFDEVILVNKVMIIKAENVEIAIKMFTRKTGIAKRNIIGIKTKKPTENCWQWV